MFGRVALRKIERTAQTKEEFHIISVEFGVKVHLTVTVPVCGLPMHVLHVTRVFHKQIILNTNMQLEIPTIAVSVVYIQYDNCWCFLTVNET